MDTFIKYLDEEKDKQHPFEGKNAWDLIAQAIVYIGDEDPHVRDDIVYICLAIISERLSAKERQRLLDIYLSEEYLFYDMNNLKTNSVLTRTFTLLQLVVLLYYHNQDGLVDEDFVGRIARALADYLQKEQVMQGYDKEVGWKHALAHSADVLGQLLLTKELKKEDMQDLLDQFLLKVQIDDYGYIDNEDERIVDALEKGLKSGCLTEELLLDFAKKATIYDKHVDRRAFIITKTNVKHLLRSMYFRFKDRNQDLANALEEILKEHKEKKKS